MRRAARGTWQGSELAALYGVTTKRFNEQVKRKVSSHDQAVGILKTIRELMHPPVPKKRPIGFTAHLDE